MITIKDRKLLPKLKLLIDLRPMKAKNTNKNNLVKDISQIQMHLKIE